ncbi:MAG TPA: hypothetical protein DDW49_09870 [Deltaproteobacteria bacterium]|nr:MAG: hypothetical protein A2048_01650 [Deltaproteobacteria bacterium GWA2_45_12]HBF13670.1 hypothetical protein [Deltaproteobacteria bacterium]
MARVNYTEAQRAQIEELREYLRSQGVDPDVYMRALDGQGIDPAILNDPDFQAYWRLTYLQLLEILDPPLFNSLPGQLDEAYEEGQRIAGAELNALIEKLATDSPELMAYFAAHDADPNTTPEQIIGMLAAQGLINPIDEHNDSGDNNSEFVDEGARHLSEEYGLGGTYDYLIETEEGMMTARNSLFAEIANRQLEAARLFEQYMNGDLDLTEEQFNAKMDLIKGPIEILMAQANIIDKTLNQIFEQFSKLEKDRQEGLQSVIRNIA